MTGRDEVRRRAAWALGIYTLGLVYVLLGPSAAVPTASVSLVSEVATWLGFPDWLTAGHRVEFGLNVLVLVPVPVLGSIVWPALSWRDWTAAGFVISVGVEAVQAAFLDARSATFSDVVANTAGGLLGGVLVAVLRRVRPGLFR